MVGRDSDGGKDIYTKIKKIVQNGGGYYVLDVRVMVVVVCLFVSECRLFKSQRRP